MTVVNEICKGYRKFCFLVRGVFIKADSFEIVVCEVKNFSAGSLVNATTLHSYKTVFHDVEKSDTVRAANLVKFKDDFLCAHLFTVECNGTTLLEVDSDVGGSIGSHKRRNSHFKEAFLLIHRLVACILKIKTFVAEVPEVLIL